MSNLVVSYWSPQTEKWRGVKFFRFNKSTFAPFLISNSTHLTWPLLQAVWIGKLPLSSQIIMSAPLSRRNWTMSVYPLNAAWYKSVWPIWYCLLMLMDLLKVALTCCKLPLETAETKVTLWKEECSFLLKLKDDRFSNSNRRSPLRTWILVSERS